MDPDTHGFGRRRTNPAQGTDQRQNGWRRTSVDFDAETFEAIRRRALAAGHSFAEELRTLVDWGLEAAEAEHV